MKKNKKQKNAQLLFIDVVAKKVSRIEVPKDLKELKGILNYEFAEELPLGNGDFMFTDENALAKEPDEIAGWFMLEGEIPIRNNAIVYRPNLDGTIVGTPKITLSQLERVVRFENMKDLINPWTSTFMFQTVLRFGPVLSKQIFRR